MITVSDTPQHAIPRLARRKLRPVIRKVVSIQPDTSRWMDDIRERMKILSGWDPDTLTLERQVMGYFEDHWKAFSVFSREAAAYIEHHRLHEHSYLSLADIWSKVR